MANKERELSCIVDLLHEVYPDLPILDRLDMWMAGKFEPPHLFVQIQGVAVKGNTLTSYRVISEATIALHHNKVMQDGEYEPISTEPLRLFLLRERFSYRGRTDGLYIDIDSGTFRTRREKKDRTEVTFRFVYTMQIPRENVDKIKDFQVEGDVWIDA